VTTATTGVANVAATNTFTAINTFDAVTLFKDRAIFYDTVNVVSTVDISQAGIPVGVFQGLALLTGHYTAPTWINIPLDAANFAANTFYPDGPQYCTIQYGTAVNVIIRGVIEETADYLNDTDNRIIFNMPVGTRPLKRHQFLQSGGNGGQAGAFLVNTDGNVMYLAGASISETPGSAKTFHLDGINYWTN
jgi:hypothetical protein